ncbi:MAG: ACP S-malonyltransferase, partial [bacterium]
MSTAFVFPGQGSQYIGMGKITNAAIADKFFSEAQSAISLPIKKLCLEGPEDELKKTEITQPAIFTVSAIILEALKGKGISPFMAAGHSLGEYGALYAAGSISFSDTVKLLHLRGKFMQEAVPIGEGAMAAVLGLSPDIISEICRITGVAAANYN